MRLIRENGWFEFLPGFLGKREDHCLIGLGRKLEVRISYMTAQEGIARALILRCVSKVGALSQRVIAHLELAAIGQLEAVHNLVVAKRKLDQIHGLSEDGRAELHFESHRRH